MNPIKKRKVTKPKAGFSIAIFQKSGIPNLLHRFSVCEFLRDDGYVEKPQQPLLIYRENNSITSLIEALVDFLKLEQRSRYARPRPVPINDIGCRKMLFEGIGFYFLESETGGYFFHRYHEFP